MSRIVIKNHDTGKILFDKKYHSEKIIRNQFNETWIYLEGVEGEELE